jgi:large subunit ribosomal protein L4
MVKAVSYSKTGTKLDTPVKLEESVFGVEASHELVGQAYRTYLANGRSAGATTLKRGEVRGGGKKPWRQKGTGRARVGSIRVPNWRGGGITFGPDGNQNYKVTLPVRMKRLAIRHALSLQAEAGQISVIEAFTSQDGRVKSTVELLTKLGLSGSVVVVVDTKTDLLERATRNIQGLQLVSAKYLNVYTIMNSDHLVFTTEAVATVNEWLGDKE